MNDVQCIINPPSYIFCSLLDWLSPVTFNTSLFFTNKLCLDAVWGILLAHSTCVGLCFRETISEIVDITRLGSARNCDRHLWFPSALLWWSRRHHSVSSQIIYDNKPMTLINHFTAHSNNIQKWFYFAHLLTHSTVVDVGWTKVRTLMCLFCLFVYQCCWIYCFSAILYELCCLNWKHQLVRPANHHHELFYKLFGKLIYVQSLTPF